MLKSLVISNYAIINNLEIGLNNGLNIVTGETGAGKSIMVGALALILGQRADTSILKDKNNKCVVEGTFEISKYNLHSFFEQNDLDYDDLTIIRREIASNGKSRAFINDMPVNLTTMKELGIQLIDIHSQHENLNMQNNLFQLRVVDLIADNNSLLNDYRFKLNEYNQLKIKLSLIKEETEKLKNDKEYFDFQLNELEKSLLKENELEELETEFNTLSHSEEIKELLSGSVSTLSDDEYSIINSIKKLSQNLDKLTKILPEATSYFNRIESIYIELKDIENDIDKLNERIILDPERIELVNTRLNTIYSLLKKHNVNEVKELFRIKDEYKQKLENIYFSDEKILALENQITELNGKLKKASEEISGSRKKVIPSIEEQVNRLLLELGMPKSRFKIFIEHKEIFTQNGTDNVKFLFSPAKDIDFQDLSKTASGGEISRLMLSIKSLITSFTDLPSIIFDEIDTGISGEIADKMGNIIKRMSKDMQVINITHLPQIACKGDFHFLVKKVEKEGNTETQMKLLNQEERVVEIAKMLSGSELSEAAIMNARELLK